MLVCIPPPRGRTPELVGQQFTHVCEGALSHTPYTSLHAPHFSSSSPPAPLHLTRGVLVDQTGASSSSRAHLWPTSNAQCLATPMPWRRVLAHMLSHVFVCIGLTDQCRLHLVIQGEGQMSAQLFWTLSLHFGVALPVSTLMLIYL